MQILADSKAKVVPWMTSHYGPGGYTKCHGNTIARFFHREYITHDTSRILAFLIHAFKPAAHSAIVHKS